jgi:hypothetical protein
MRQLFLDFSFDFNFLAVQGDPNYCSDERRQGRMCFMLGQ